MPLALLAAAPSKKPPRIIETQMPTAAPPAPAPLRYSDWYVRDLGDYSSAQTSNASGSVFGMLCGTTCIFYVNFQKECVNGDSYPAMFNSSKLAASLDLKCHHVDGRHLLSFEPADEHYQIIKEGGVIGFAIAIQDGTFSVSRFSLSGGRQAVWKAIDIAIKKGERSQQGLRDFTI